MRWLTGAVTLFVALVAYAACPPALIACSGCSHVTFSESSAAILNQERGLYVQTTNSFTSATDLSTIRGTYGATLYHAYYRLDSYVSMDLPGSVLTDLAAALGNARTNHIKLVLRFTYNYSGSAPCTDATESQILTHISQLAPVLAANADVIAVWQAGFIGCFGQWWGSSNSLNTDQAATTAIINAEAAAVPDIALQIPYPDSVRYIFGLVLAKSQAWSGTTQSRVGVANDCFQSTYYEDTGEFGRLNGVYTGTTAQILLDRAYMTLLGAWTANGGEGPSICSTTVNYSDCVGILAPFSQYQISFLGDITTGYAPWASCIAQVINDLGYRFVLQEVYYSPSVASGSPLSLQTSLRNVGFAHPFNPRIVYAVLSDGTHTQTFPLSTEWRNWQPGYTFINTTITPTTLPAGTYSLYLWLPDNHVALQAIPDYDVQFANIGVYDGATGYNALCSSCVTVH